jgi:hypothetical protein
MASLLGMFTVMYVFMLTQTVEQNDDILNALVFLTCSAIPLFRVLYAYYDDLAVDLNDYLYTSIKGQACPMLAKGSRWSLTLTLTLPRPLTLTLTLTPSGFRWSPWERRWNFTTYL